MIDKNLLKWVDCSGLVLNLKKPKYTDTIFTKSRSFVEQELKIANVVIESKISVGFLVFIIIIDEKLNWSTHI